MTNDTYLRTDAGAHRSTTAGILSLALAILIAGVLQFAAAAKVAAGADDLRRIKDSEARVDAGLAPAVAPSDFTYLTPPGQLSERGILLDFAVAGAEFALVVLVLAAHRTRAVWLLVSLVFATFSGYGLQRLAAGLPCGCFGDLWHPPDGLTLSLDVVFVIGALTLAAISGATPRVLMATVLLAIGCAAGGYIYAAQTAPEKAPQNTPDPESTQTTPDPASNGQATTSDASPAETLLNSDLMADVREAHAAGEPTVYYVFIWDPTCTTCERFLPIVQHYQTQYQDEGDIFLQVLEFKKQDLADQLGIKDYDWPDSPTVFLVQDSKVIDQPGGDEAPLPDKVHELIAAGEPLTAE